MYKIVQREKKSKKRFNIIKKLKHNIFALMILYFLKIQSRILESFQNNNADFLLLIVLAEIMTSYKY